MTIHSSPPTSFAAKLHYEAIQRKERLYGKDRVVNISLHPLEIPPAPVATSKASVLRTQSDEHVRIWRWIKKDKARRWLASKCQEFDVAVFDMVGHSRKHDLTGKRMMLYMLAKHEQGMSNSAIARLFGGRDHTTIIAGIRKAELQRFGKTSDVDKRRRTTRVTDEEAKEIGAAYLGGMPIMEIRGTFHICARTLYRLAKLHGWRRPQIRRHGDPSGDHPS